MEGGEPIPARGMEDGQGRIEGGLQLPAQGMEGQHGRVEGGQDLAAQRPEDEHVRLEGEQELHVQGLEDGQDRMEEEQQPPGLQPAGQGREFIGQVEPEQEEVADADSRPEEAGQQEGDPEREVPQGDSHSQEIRRSVARWRAAGGGVEPIPARGMEDGHGRMEGGGQLPAQGMEGHHGRVEGGQHLRAQRLEDGNGRLEEGQELRAQGYNDINEEHSGEESNGVGVDNKSVEEDVAAAGVEREPRFLLTGRAKPDLPPPTPGAGEEDG